MSDNIGLAKSAEQTQQIQPTQVKQTKDTPPLTHDTEIVHDEIYKFFNIASYDNFDKGHLTTISRWAADSRGIGEGLKKLMSLEMKLGAPHFGETRMSKLYNWIRLSDNINSTRDNMDKELRSIRTRTKETISSLQGEFRERALKLDAEIKKLTKSYERAAQHYKLNATDNSKKIRNKYGKQLNELREMRTAFKGRG